MKWSDVTLAQFLQLRDVLQIEDETDKLVSIAEILLGEDITSLPITEFSKKVKELEFLKDPIPDVKVVTKLNINGHKYNIDAVLGHITAAQYVDFTNYMKEEDKESIIDKLLAVFFIPEGHKYNDGYDMMEVITDMQSIPVDIAMAESFFFSRQFNKFIEIFQSYSIKSLKKTNLPEKVKKNLIEAVEGSVNLAFSPSYLNSAK